ncbi:MAG: glycosyltransferase family 2 protein [Lunatimonas sp.]|uniref:glycosyltransferase family 2 protein n=1 Tax=Lunatimonas sp. TaxID=2060141 RepID=UPI00263AA9EF|nr:glycosyltransferase family 2 protein [Lunatimonas sp.]MCC5938699.1 glycosyltransferase family 2 protein [Lunatimonas sp.]
MPTAAIVILNYNGEDMFRRFLPSVVQHSIFDIIVVDNASTDNSLAFLAKYYPTVKVVKLKENGGYSGGYNAGLTQLHGSYSYYILLNSDIAVTPEWDSRMIRFLEARPEMAVAQPKILSYVQEGFFDYAGAAGGFLDSLGYPFCRGRILHTLERDEGQYQDSVLLDWASGACFCVKADIFHENGGFDDHFFAHMEEIDFCWRIRSRGWKIGVNPEVSVFHLGGGTLQKSHPKKTYLNFRNSLFMLYKNLSNAAFYKVFVLRMVLDFGAMVHIVFTSGLAHGWAIHKAYRHFLRDRGKIRKTSLGQPSDITSKRHKINSVILAYYLRRMTRYTDFY